MLDAFVLWKVIGELLLAVLRRPICNLMADIVFNDASTSQ